MTGSFRFRMEQDAWISTATAAVVVADVIFAVDPIGIVVSDRIESRNLFRLAGRRRRQTDGIVGGDLVARRRYRLGQLVNRAANLLLALFVDQPNVDCRAD